MPRVLVAKTGLDGHWRGVMAVAAALREAGFEVILLGMATAEQIAAAAVQEDVDLVGLNIGGHIEVAERVITAVRDAAPGTPVIVGGTVPPWAVRRLAEQDVSAFPPGSRLQEIVDAARALTGDDGGEQA